jgi:hypothetical protein
MATPITGITDIVEAQNDKEVTANEAHSDLEGQVHDFHTEDCTGSSNVTIATADAANHYFFDLTGAIGANIDVIVPADASPPSYAKTYMVRNSTTGAFTITFKVSGGTGIVLPRTGWHLLRSDGTDMQIVADLGYVVSQNGGPGVFTANHVVFNHVFDVPVDTLAELEGSHAVLNAATTGQIDFTVHKNGAPSLGNLRFLAAGTVGTFGTGGSIAAQSFVAGDRLHIQAPAVPDGTAADIAITIRGDLA